MSIKAQTPGYVIERTAKRLKWSFQQTLQALDAELTADQWVLLDHICKVQGRSQQYLAQETAKDKPTVTRILDRLQDKKLVERRPMEDDRRSFGIYPTKRGEELVAELMPKVRQFRVAHFQGLEDGDVETLLRIMDRINQNITALQTVDYALL